MSMSMCWERIPVYGVIKGFQETKLFSLVLENNSSSELVLLPKPLYSFPFPEAAQFIRISIQNFVANRRFCVQRGFSILPVIGLTSTLMITWEVITSYADTLPQKNVCTEADGRYLIQDSVQRIRKWWPCRIDIWISFRLVRRDTSGSSHGRDGFDVRFRQGNVYHFVPCL